MSKNPKIAKLASNPPRWANLVPNLSKWPQIVEVAWLMCAGSIITPWKVCVYKNGCLDSQCNINCTKSSQIWAKSHSSAPSQLACPHSMNGRAPGMMRVHMWLLTELEFSCGCERPIMTWHMSN